MNRDMKSKWNCNWTDMNAEMWESWMLRCCQVRGDLFEGKSIWHNYEWLGELTKEGLGDNPHMHTLWLTDRYLLHKSLHDELTEWARCMRTFMQLANGYVGIFFVKSSLGIGLFLYSLTSFMKARFRRSYSIISGIQVLHYLALCGLNFSLPFHSAFIPSNRLVLKDYFVRRRWNCSDWVSDS